jgi:hypothetical protein
MRLYVINTEESDMSIKSNEFAGFHLYKTGCYIEVFFHAHDSVTEPLRDENGERIPEGWYWWECENGFLPDGDPIGPFDTSEQAYWDGKTDPEEVEPNYPDDLYDNG